MKIKFFGKKTSQTAAPSTFGEFEGVPIKQYSINLTREPGSEEEVSVKEEQLVSLTFEDGTVWYAQAGELEQLMVGNVTRSGDGSESDVIMLPSYLRLKTPERGVIGEIALKLFSIFDDSLIEKAGRETAKAFAARVERKIADRGEGLYQLGFDMVPVKPIGPDLFPPGRATLLMIHGFGASCTSSFGDLRKDGSQWKSIVDKYGKNIFAYDHFSFTKSPLENVLYLVQLMPRRKVTLHLLTQSRGGLVGELFCLCVQTDDFIEKSVKFLNDQGRTDDATTLLKIREELQGKEIVVEKFIRVACPAGGTNLLGNRTDVVLNALLNLVQLVTGALFNPLADALRELVIATAQRRTRPDELPGLEAMLPNSPIMRLVNMAAPERKLPHDLYVVAGDAAPDGLLRALAWLIANAIFPGDNDFVVDTYSMYMGAQRVGQSYYLYIQGNRVHHLAYFGRNDVKDAIVGALGAERGTQPKAFKPIRADLASRGLFGLPDGSFTTPAPSGSRPIVVLLPGMMGSNLSIKDGSDWEEVWIDYGRIWRGQLASLKVEVGAEVGEKVVATSLVGDAYRAFSKFLQDNGYDVVVFPFDWRMSLAESGDRLRLMIEDQLLPLGKPIKIVAHSMGGLVVRDLMVQHADFWDELKKDPQFRCILLGTPWRGSYMIPQVITGRGKTINSISLLDFKHSKKKLLQIFVEYPGLLDLLPHYGHEFGNQAFWQLLEGLKDEKDWVSPSAESLANYSAYKAVVQSAAPDLDRIIYVAGKSDKTVADLMLKGKYGHVINKKTRAEIVQESKHSNEYLITFYATHQGDGSVTWESGIPFPKDLPTPNLYYTNTEHGELANDPRNFGGLLDLLKRGTTGQLMKSPPITRSNEQLTELPPFEILPNKQEDLLRSALGMSVGQYYQGTAAASDTPIKISMVNGHLRFATHPIIVGHFKGDGIVSAEKVLDAHMGKALSKRERMNLYPGAIGTTLVLLPTMQCEQGAIIVGLGEPETLTPFLLSQTIEAGCTNYLLTLERENPASRPSIIGISSLLIGSGYADLSLVSSVTAILDGVTKANRKVRETAPTGTDFLQVTELELLEIYRGKADNAFSILDQIIADNRGFGITLQYPIQQVDGSKSMLEIEEDREWWTRITATERRDGTGKKSIYISISNGRAKVEERNLLVNPDIIDGLLHEHSQYSDWNMQLARTLFELLIPNDFKISFRNQQNILWILDETTARYPVELLHYDVNAPVPIGVKAGIIRQFSLPDDRPIASLVANQRALVIGDPLLAPNKGANQLLAAEEEAKLVGALLTENGLDVKSIIQGTYTDVLNNIFDEYRIIHIASHGVIDFGPHKRTGILLSNGKENIVLTPADIKQITNIPDLVFVNCCHMGHADASKEMYFRERHQLAANIGTQFIKNGVKAVVVAGWAVNDAAAKCFAGEFYRQMLNGATFGNAVRLARELCFTDFPGNNTWGAYQCYGDQFYRFRNTNGHTNGRQKFVLGNEALTALEDWMGRVNTGTYDTVTLKQELEAISQKIEMSVINRMSEVLEKEALAYAEIGEMMTALLKLEALFESDSNTHTSKALERYFELRGQLAVQGTAKKTDEGPNEAPSEFDKLINDMKAQLRLDKSYQRKCLLGDTYKRRAIHIGQTEDGSHIEDVLNCFSEAYNTRENTSALDNIYALSNILVANYLLQKTGEDWKKAKKQIGKPLKLGDIGKLLEELEVSLEKGDQRKTRENSCALILIKECRLLFLTDKEEAEHKVIVNAIKKIYGTCLKMAGSPRAKMEKVEQTRFILQFINTAERSDLTAFKQSMQTLYAHYLDFL